MDFKELAKPYFNDLEKHLIELCSINSTYCSDTITDYAPYGLGVNKALNYIAKLAKKYGYENKNIDGRCVEITIGKGEKLISIFAHADVVPATGFWDNDPFKPVYKDGKLYGRGTSDDKGPLMAAFYAMKLLNDNNLINNYRVRLVVGGDEERGASCLEYYFSKKETEIPTYGFTPDADFPVVYGEKGISNLKSIFEIEIPNVKEIKAGSVPNAVIDKAVVHLIKKDEAFISYLKDKNINFEVVANSIIFYGKSAHGSTPELGINSAIIALKELANFYKVEKLANFVNKISDTTGKAFDSFSETDNLGATTFNIGVLSYEDNKLTYITNFRHPENVVVNDMVKNMDNVLSTKTSIISSCSYLLFDRKSELIKNLMEAYKEETGDYDSKPLYLGGGTYAKDAKNTVAFGATFPNENTHMHEPNEFMDIEHLHQCVSIYAHAIYLLGNSK